LTLADVVGHRITPGHGLAAEKLQGPKLQAGGAAVRKQVEVENPVGRVSFESRVAGMSEVSTIGAWCRGE
jgi:hypothetical protein